MLDSHSTNERTNGNVADAIGAITQKKIADYLEIDYDDLEIYERCGRGSYGSVYRGLWKSRNKIVAVKKLLNLENEVQIFLN